VGSGELWFRKAWVILLVMERFTFEKIKN